MFGLTSAEMKLINTIIISPLTNGGAKVFLFGSRLTDKHQKYSDIDLLIRGHVEKRLLAKIKENIEESHLPYKVDLVLEDDLATSFKESVLSNMQEWTFCE